jgi:hypothetical protein
MALSAPSALTFAINHMVSLTLCGDCDEVVRCSCGNKPRSSHHSTSTIASSSWRASGPAVPNFSDTCAKVLVERNVAVSIGSISPKQTGELRHVEALFEKKQTSQPSLTRVGIRRRISLDGKRRVRLKPAKHRRIHRRPPSFMNSFLVRRKSSTPACRRFTRLTRKTAEQPRSPKS